MRKLNRNAPHIIGLVGYMRSGKDTVADCLKTLALGNYVTVSFAYPIYKAVSVILDEPVNIVERLKDQEVPWLGVTRRHLLQTIGTQWGRYLVNEEIWIRHALRTAAKHHSEGRNVIITDVRFPNEVEAIQTYGHQNNTVWRVHRAAVVPGHSADQHESESYIDKLSVDQAIMNNGSIDDLTYAVERTWNYTFK